MLLNSGEVRDQMLASNQRDTVCLSYLTVKQWKDQLAELETGGLDKPYQAVNQFGYLGKYQISNTYLKKFGRIPRESYLKSPRQQEITMNRLICHYLNFIHQHGLDMYIGRRVAGVLVTREGLLAGYHQHPVALIKWLESNGLDDRKDGNSIKVSTFVKKFDYSYVERN